MQIAGCWQQGMATGNDIQLCCKQDGRCKTLDASADGYMRGEGCIVHMLEALEPEELAAVHLENQAVILYGTAVNQDGRSSSLTVRALFISPHPRQLAHKLALTVLMLLMMAAGAVES